MFAENSSKKTPQGFKKRQEAISPLSFAPYQTINFQLPKKPILFGAKPLIKTTWPLIEMELQHNPKDKKNGSLKCHAEYIDSRVKRQLYVYTL